MLSGKVWAREDLVSVSQHYSGPNYTNGTAHTYKRAKLVSGSNPLRTRWHRTLVYPYTGCWETISVDFVFGLPNTATTIQASWSLDSLSKMTHLAPCPNQLKV